MPQATRTASRSAPGAASSRTRAHPGSGCGHRSRLRIVSSERYTTGHAGGCTAGKLESAPCHQNRPARVGWTAAHSATTARNGNARRTARSGGSRSITQAQPTATIGTTHAVSLLSSANAKATRARPVCRRANASRASWEQSSIHRSWAPGTQESSTPHGASAATPPTATVAVAQPAQRATSAAYAPIAPSQSANDSRWKGSTLVPKACSSVQ